jgi:hypothetical protein
VGGGQVVVKINNGLMPLGDILSQAIPRPVRPQFDAANESAQANPEFEPAYLNHARTINPIFVFSTRSFARLGCRTAIPVMRFDSGNENRVMQRWKSKPAAFRILKGEQTRARNICALTLKRGAYRTSSAQASFSRTAPSRASDPPCAGQNGYQNLKRNKRNTAALEAGWGNSRCAAEQTKEN